MDQKTFNLIDRIAHEHSRKTFGFLTEEDLRNEIWLICLEKIDSFDYSRGELENFLRVAVKNRLVNKFKDITKSVRSPCPRCKYYNPTAPKIKCKKFRYNKDNCSKWTNYRLSVESRNSLLNASEPQIESYSDIDIVDQLGVDELKKIVTEKLSSKYHYDMQQLISGGKISKQRLKRLKREIVKILYPEEYKEEKLTQLTINKNLRKRKKNAKE